MSSASVRSKNDKLLTGPKLIKNQFMAMLMKKYLSIARTWLLQIIQILIPVAFLIIAIIASRNMNKYTVESLPKLPLSLDIYEDPIILVQDDVSNRFSEHFLQIVQGHQVQKVTSIEEAMLNLVSVFASVPRLKNPFRLKLFQTLWHEDTWWELRSL